MDDLDLFAPEEGAPLDGAALRWLLDQGIAPLSIGSSINWPVLAQRVQFESDGTYRPGPEFAEFALVFGVIDNSMIDIAVWQPRSDAIATRLGVGWAIGQGHVLNHDLGRTGLPIQVFRSPVGWLRAARKGIVIIDWRRAALALSDRFVEPEDDQHGREISVKLALPRPRFISKSQRRAAA